MSHFRVLALAVISSLCFTLPAIALTIDLSGKVIGSKASSPIAGCTVYVEGASSPTATTTEQGTFALKGSTPIAATVSRGSELVRMRGQQIEFTLTEPARVSVEVFSLAGKLLAKTVDAALSSGIHRVDPLSMPSTAATGIYLVNARIGERQFAFRVSELSGSSRPITRENPMNTTPLAKTAVGDTLVVDCPDLPNAYVPLTSLSQKVSTVTVRQFAKKPNFMFILADDLTAADLAFMGNPDMISPNLDKLAAEGMTFEKAYCATAMCAPLRMSLYTGIYPVRNGGYPNHSSTYKHIRSVVHHLKAYGYRVGHIGKRHIRPSSVFPFDYLTSNQNEPNLKSIRNWVNKDTTNPYCLFVCSKLPHGPWVSGDPSAYDANTIKVDPYHVDTKEYREAKVKYYAEVTALDNLVGGCRTIVEESKQKDNTMLMFSSEQGNSFPGAKWTCWEPGLGAVFVAHFPGVIRPGRRTEAMVNHIDVVPTFIDLLGGAQIDSLDGRSFEKVLFGKSDAHRTHDFGAQTTFGAINSPKGGYAVRSVRTLTHKYIWNLQHQTTYTNAITGGGAFKSWKTLGATDTFADMISKRYQNRPEFEFYDLTMDKWEMNNLADDPAQKPIMDSLRTLLDAWMTQQGDKGIKTEQTKR